MSCDAFRESLVDFDWDEPARQRAVDLVAHLATCSECREAASDLDELRLLLASDERDSEVEPPGGWADFQQSLTSAIRPRRNAWPLRPMAIAASLLVVGMAFMVGRMVRPPASNPAQATAIPATLPATIPAKVPATLPSSSQRALAAFGSKKINLDVETFKNVSTFVGEQTSWVLMSDDFTDVGTASGKMPANNKVLLLRFILTRAGNVVSDADLIVVPGRSADLTVPLHDGHSLHYQIGTSKEQSSRLSLALQLDAVKGEPPLVALSTNLDVEPGQSVTAGRIATSAGEYQLNISVAHETLPQDSI